MRFLPIVFAVIAIAAPAVAAPADMAAILAGPQRSEANKARDQYRHPVETLKFFGLKPAMTVVEITPSGGWYTEILAPYLRDHGRYIGAGAWGGTEGGAKSVAKFKAKLDADPANYGKVEVTTFGKDHYDIAKPGSADMVLTFREIHNYVTGGYGPETFKSFYAALKHGGGLGVVEHRLPENAPANREATSGYMKVSTVKRLAEAAGFKFAGASEVNANPKDTADYPDGVWTLPPTYQLGDKDRAKYAAIGESDRMTLKFVKP
ncbi:methyltransferase [Polymorphobacter sp. PAMC 29334]|uniref:class I SAM-dependent methyltransferase n=1 Tax=Polymorphobacter sp. PAMC 29334 TaxID=2862331 RepID=UPI001C75137B|nr:methyltransferase [Polymorphobacter sp. PAMC 29334]QYE35193.1 methyltransferase [Polymorphobacter sp. PAMC 29334]